MKSLQVELLVRLVERLRREILIDARAVNVDLRARQLQPRHERERERERFKLLLFLFLLVEQLIEIIRARALKLRNQ